MGGFARFLKQVWFLTAPYFRSEERWSAFAFVGVILGISLGIVYVNKLLNDWYGRFFEAIQNYDEAAFFSEIIYWTVLVSIALAVLIIQYVLRQRFLIRWRRWLTEHYMSDWLTGRAYYNLQLADYGTDNPDQRIADDIRQFVERTFGLTVDFIRNAVTLVVFLGILWALSGAITVTLGSYSFAVYGFMVWAAIAYAVIGTLVVHWVSHRLVALNVQQEKVEADFRFSLIRVRENAEGLALYAGEATEEQSLRRRFGAVVTNYLSIIRVQKYLVGLSGFYDYLSTLVPYALAAPRYFAKEMTLGGLQQTASAFSQVQGALSWFVSFYPSLIEWAANVQRLSSFREAIDKIHNHVATIEREGAAGGDIAMRGLVLDRPDGSPLVQAEVTLKAGENLLVTGPSGAGKSTLFRALAGIWPFGRGFVTIPSTLAPERVLFLPQKPYMPIGSLRAAVSYPAAEGQFDDDAIRQALHDADLAAMAGRLDEHGHWQLSLSGGELQRLALARALLHRPDWLFLDEATSAVDEAGEARLYDRLRQRLPGTTIVSIGHRSTLKAFHDRELPLRLEVGGIATVGE